MEAVVKPVKKRKVRDESKGRKPRVFRRPDNYCCTCGRLIPKDRTTSWHKYDRKKYCNQECTARGLTKDNSKIKHEILLSDGTIMPVAGYINKKTNNLCKTIDFFAGVIDHVDELADDAESPGKYKGFEITFDYYNKISAWMCDNAIGKPGQRREAPETVERTREELLAGLKSMEVEG